MFPVICKIGPFAVYSYGLMLAVAVIFCSVLLSRDARILKIKSEVIFDLAFWAVLSGILGARLFFVLLNISFFANYPREIIMIQNGGLAWQGGFIAGTAAVLWYIYKNKIPLWETLDLVAPYIALGQAIGRIGCLLNGCCYGRTGHLYGHGFVHPSQLYASGMLLIVFFILKKYQKTVSIPGKVFVMYLILASLQRFINEFFRGDHLVTYFGLSIFQIVSVCIFFAGIYVNRIISKHRRGGPCVRP